MSSSPTAPAYSVVIPFFNEEGAIPELLTELRTAMEALGVVYEVIMLDDGSSDNSFARLQTAASTWPQCRCLALRPNRGQAAALIRGFAEWIITLDGDGQNCPADIPALIAATAQGYDMVTGVRQNRQDSWFRLAMSRVANCVRSKILRDNLRDSGCALKVFRREITAHFWPIKSLYSFMPAFAVAAGYRLTEIPVRHRERTTGVSKYGFVTFAWRPLVDLLALRWLLWHRAIFRAERDR
jgi:dolichol-phosphate mannosyltransferase